MSLTTEVVSTMQLCDYITDIANITVENLQIDLLSDEKKRFFDMVTVLLVSHNFLMVRSESIEFQAPLTNRLFKKDEHIRQYIKWYENRDTKIKVSLYHNTETGICNVVVKSK